MIHLRAGDVLRHAGTTAMGGMSCASTAIVGIKKTENVIQAACSRGVDRRPD
ncbi:MAG: hypothetical protein IT358_09395 [Gemmatimonadaceae bacterium]|nr:hypothetical protein [Gemmatimonadaceae bacterium]